MSGGRFDLAGRASHDGADVIDAKLRDEHGRQSALDRYAVLDTAPDPRFDAITGLVRAVFEVPIAAVSLVDRERQWFKSCDGLDVSETTRAASLCTHTIRQRAPLIIPDTLADARFRDNPLVVGPPYIRSYAGMPLSTPDGYNVGSLCAIDAVPREFTDAQIAMLRDFGKLVIAELELRQIAQSDFLTGALSRRGFVARLDATIAQRRAAPAALIAFDIDHFKTINDRFGHAAGDAVLKAIAGVCTAALRDGDSFGRLGGEEFALLLHGVDVASALAAAERCRQAIAALSIDVGEKLHVTASFGIAPLVEGASTDDWLCHADAALYAAKAAGRDCCRITAPLAVAA